MFQYVVWRVRHVVENSDHPGWTIDADPIDHVSLTPCWHFFNAGIPECPDVLLRCHSNILVQDGQDLFVRAGIRRLGIAELVLELIRDLEVDVGHLVTEEERDKGTYGMDGDGSAILGKGTKLTWQFKRKVALLTKSELTSARIRLCYTISRPGVQANQSS